MEEVKISTKYQVVIPKEVRRSLNLQPGQKMVAIVKDGVIHLIPNKEITELKGFLKGINVENIREEKERF